MYIPGLLELALGQRTTKKTWKGLLGVTAAWKFMTALIDSAKSSYACLKKHSAVSYDS